MVSRACSKRFETSAHGDNSIVPTGICFKFPPYMDFWTGRVMIYIWVFVCYKCTSNFGTVDHGIRKSGVSTPDKTSGGQRSKHFYLPIYLSWTGWVIYIIEYRIPVSYVLPMHGSQEFYIDMCTKKWIKSRRKEIAANPNRKSKVGFWAVFFSTPFLSAIAMQPLQIFSFVDVLGSVSEDQVRVIEPAVT